MDEQETPPKIRSSAPPVPDDLIRPGLVWGFSGTHMHVYAKSRKHCRGLPPEIDGCPVVIHVIGEIRPASR